MTPTPCPLCDDTGWRPLGEGKNRRVVRCECRERTRGERLLQAARIPKRYEHCTLESFDTSRDQSLRWAKQGAEKFISEYPFVKGLLLEGPYGVGKTHLGVAIIKELVARKNVHCLFCDYRELLKEIRNSYNPSVADTEMDVLRPVLEVPVLLLDELGAERRTDWVWDTVSHILNTRYNEDRTTIFTTNYPNRPSLDTENEQRNAAQLATREETLGDRISDRMWSRLQEMCVSIPLRGKDARTHSPTGGLR